MKTLNIGDRVRDRRPECNGRIGTVEKIENTWAYDFFFVKWGNGDTTWFNAEGGWDVVELIDNVPLPLPG